MPKHQRNKMMVPNRPAPLGELPAAAHQPQQKN
jgi:hypothetical protein